MSVGYPHLNSRGGLSGPPDGSPENSARPWKGRKAPGTGLQREEHSPTSYCPSPHNLSLCLRCFFSNWEVPQTPSLTIRPTTACFQNHSASTISNPSNLLYSLLLAKYCPPPKTPSSQSVEPAAPKGTSHRDQIKDSEEGRRSWII